MQLLIIRLILFILLFNAYQFQENQTDKIENERNCRERNRLVVADKGDLYTIIDATFGQKLVMQCHYCNENDDGEPKIWYKLDLLNKSQQHEVVLDMNSNLTANRVHVNPEHSLIIHNVHFNDSGIYFCMGIEMQESENKYNYLVDLVLENNMTSFESGNLTYWRKYYEDYYKPVNKLLKTSQGEEFVKLRNKLKIHMQIMTEWEPWGICEVCGRSKGDGRRRKKGFCRIKIDTIKNETVNFASLSENELFIANAYALSCRSIILSEYFPGISNMTKIIPHFVQEEHCEGTCNPDEEGLGKGWKTGKSLDFKYKKSIVLAQNAHLTLICPESTLENVVIWKRNGKILPAGESVPPKNPADEPHITVDTFSTLYLISVTSDEEGNYTCEVDKTRMQQVRVYVVSKSRLLTQAFLRHVMYLAFVLSLTLSCYCAGLIVTWTRRDTFKTYEDLMREKAEKNEVENLV